MNDEFYACLNCGKPLGESEYDPFEHQMIFTCDFCHAEVVVPMVLLWQDARCTHDL